MTAFPKAAVQNVRIGIELNVCGGLDLGDVLDVIADWL
jgi:hypothetical protein